MALSVSSHLALIAGGRTVSVGSSGVCPCPSSASARLQRSSALALLSPAVHASSSSLVFRDGTDLLTRRRPERHVRQPGRLQVVGLFGLGMPELVVIAGVAALLFGPTKLPEIGKSLGKTVKGFQVAAKEVESEIKATAAAEAAAAEEAASSKPEEQPQTPAATTGAEKDSTSG
eukprot:TRINITY_DN446_c0_g1_i1.p1 TRINITY_DN446_c0_g1~~TRINITY_DN446_c0_g1_i1.p1  ORF type:complete len:190 (+),score=30.35 TRINITY_DN446_c0_g1_i1:49-570(+)